MKNILKLLLIIAINIIFFDLNSFAVEDTTSSYFSPIVFQQVLELWDTWNKFYIDKDEDRTSFKIEIDSHSDIVINRLNSTMDDEISDKLSYGWEDYDMLLFHCNWIDTKVYEWNDYDNFIEKSSEPLFTLLFWSQYYSIYINCEKSYYDIINSIPFKEKDSLYIPDEFMKYSFSMNNDLWRLDSDVIKDNFIRPKPALQPTFADIIYFQLKTISTYLEILESIWYLNRSNYSNIFDNYNTYTSYLTWIEHFWRYSDKMSFVDAFSWWITLKDIWVANEIVLWLSSQLECSLKNWVSNCLDKKITFSKSIWDDYDFYTIEQINATLQQDSEISSSLYFYKTYLNWLSDDFNSLSWLDSFQASYFLKNLLTDSVWDLTTDDNLDLWYAVNLRFDNIERIMNNLKESNNYEKTNILWFYNFYFEYNKYTKWLQKWVEFKSHVNEWDVDWFFVTTLRELDSVDKIFLYWDDVELISNHPLLIMQDLKNSLIEEIDYINIDYNSIDIQFIWWEIDYSSIKTYYDKYKLFNGLFWSIVDSEIHWTSFSYDSVCYMDDWESICLDWVQKLDWASNIIFVIDIWKLEWTDLEKYITVDYGLNNWLVWYYSFEWDFSNKVQNIYDFVLPNESAKVSFKNWIKWQWIHLNGSDKTYLKMEWSSNLNFAWDFTVSAWYNLYWNNKNKKRMTLISKGDDSWRIHNEWTSDRISFWTTYVDGKYHFYDMSSYYPQSTGEWHHVAISYDKSNWTMTLFVDWELLRTNYPENRLISNSSNYEILLWNNAERLSDDRTFHWLIDELYLYNRVLSHSEIQELYNLSFNYDY